MIYYYHAYLISSGKEQKLIEKVYKDEKVARENHSLMGGSLRVLVEVS